MGQYGRVALRARCLIIENHLEAIDAWRKAAEAIITSPSSREKGCPHCAFIGLCEEGYVMGVEKGGYSQRPSKYNKRYATDAANYLLGQKEKGLNTENFSNTCLWREVSQPKPEKQQGQMDVVLALWRNESIQMP